MRNMNMMQQGEDDATVFAMPGAGGLIIMLGIVMIVGKKGPNKYGTATLPPA